MEAQCYIVTNSTNTTTTVTTTTTKTKITITAVDVATANFIPSIRLNLITPSLLTTMTSPWKRF